MLKEKEFNIEREIIVNGLKELSQQFKNISSTLDENKFTYQEYVELFQIMKRYKETLKILM